MKNTVRINMTCFRFESFIQSRLNTFYLLCGLHEIDIPFSYIDTTHRHAATANSCVSNCAMLVVSAAHSYSYTAYGGCSRSFTAIRYGSEYVHSMTIFEQRRDYVCVCVCVIVSWRATEEVTERKIEKKTNSITKTFSTELHQLNCYPFTFHYL